MVGSTSSSVLEAHFRSEIAAAAVEFRNVQRLRCAVKLLILAVLLICGMSDGLLHLAVLFVGYEIVGTIFVRRLNGRIEDASIIEASLFAGLIVTSTVLLVYPTILVIEQHSFPLFVIGGLWALGVLCYVAVSFNRMPWLNAISVLASGGLCFLALNAALRAPMLPGTPAQVTIAFICLFAFISLAFYIFHTQNRMNAALVRAQKASAQRMTEIAELARRDELTGIYNRRAFDHEVGSWLRHAGPEDEFWIIVVDLNDFKPINDTLSHDAGDALLIEIAQRLRDFVGRGNVAARLGGDEFILALYNDGTLGRPAEILFRLDQMIRRPLIWRRRQLSVTAAIGMAISDAAPRVLHTVCAQADRAMYRAKHENSALPVIYSPLIGDNGSAVEDRRFLEEAMERDEITAFFQPKVSLDSEKVKGFEALARWVRSDGTVLAPTRFLPWIGSAGLDDLLTVHIAGRVCAWMQKWHSEGAQPLDVSINVSESALATFSGRDMLLEAIRPARPLIDAGWRLTIEITENVFFARSGTVFKESIQKLREAGCRIALDDFGTGYASLRHLRELHCDEIKIDRSFTADLGQDVSADVLVNAIVEIARTLDLNVIAEGVETTGQREMLRGRGCLMGQGYLWGHATPGDDVMKLLGAPKELMAGS